MARRWLLALAFAGLMGCVSPPPSLPGTVDVAPSASPAPDARPTAAAGASSEEVEQAPDAQNKPLGGVAPTTAFVLDVSPRLPCPGQRVTLSGALPQGAWAHCYIARVVDWPNGKVPRCIFAESDRLGVVQVDAVQRFHLEATIPEHLPREGYFAIYVFGADSSTTPRVLCNGDEVRIALCGYLDAK